MTWFRDPFAPLNQQPAQADLGAQQAAYTSPAAPIIPGQLTTISYPIGATGGAVPPQLSYVVLANVSPYAIVVSQQRVIGTIAPYTSDKFQLNTQAAFTFLPSLPPNFLPTSLPPMAGGEAAYASWYENDPGGSYPCAIGPGFPLNNQMIIQAVNPPGSLGPYSFRVQTEPWMQTLAVRIIQVGGTATGFRVEVFDNNFPSTDPGMNGLLIGSGQWAFFPINGMSPLVTISNILNSTLGGTMNGTMMVHGLAGPTFAPRAGQLFNPALTLWPPVTQVGLVADINAPATAITPLIPDTVTGSAVRVRGVSIASVTAPAAAQNIQLQGTFAGVIYRRYSVPAALISIVDGSSYVVGGASGRIDPYEGLSVNNLTSVVVRVSCTYDLIPWPGIGADQSSG